VMQRIADGTMDDGFNQHSLTSRTEE
jgi:hypothetical protein